MKQMNSRRLSLNDWGLCVLFLGFAVFSGNFLLARLFGIYDDDFTYLPAFSWSWNEMLAQVQTDFLNWPQGRPLAYGLGHLLFFLTVQGSSLGLAYLTSFVLVLLNSVLLMRLSLQFLPLPGAMLAGSVLALYPAETSRVILMMRVFNQLNLTFLLAALLLYMNGRRWQSYLAAAVMFYFIVSNLF